MSDNAETVTVYSPGNDVALTYTRTVGKVGSPTFTSPHQVTLTGSAALIACWQQEAQGGDMTLGDATESDRLPVACACAGCAVFLTSQGVAACNVCFCEHARIQRHNLRRAAHIVARQLSDWANHLERQSNG